MENLKNHAWIMYALAGASQNAPARFAAISQVADGINHAVPTHKELQLSLKWLIENGFAKKQGSDYLLTKKGDNVVASIRENYRTTSLVWSALTNELDALTNKR